MKLINVNIMSQLTSRGLDNTSSAFVSDIYISFCNGIYISFCNGISSLIAPFYGPVLTKYCEIFGS